MRYIKFRGQRADDKEWVYGFLTKCQNRIWENGQSSQDGYKLQIISHEMPIGVWDVIAETVGQYTGLKDKNGVEIYEGDIVNFFFVDRFLDVMKYTKQVVVFENQMFSARFPLYKVKDIEVIGNIHSNPELLK